MSDRTVHAQSADGRIEIVRYDRQGRWYMETMGHGPEEPPTGRHRLSTVAEAVTEAIRLEDEGGMIFHYRPGGNQFDTKAQGAKQKRARHR